MWQYFSGGSGTTTAPKVTSKYDEQVPPPPSGGPVVAPPRPPRGAKRVADPNFKFTGFSAPPKVPDYSKDDYSAYTLGDSSYLDTASKGPGLLEKITSHPRARNCMESIKLGFKMGGAVGGIFGSLTGFYSSVKYRNLTLLPVSMVV
ncbi:hypothetical protein X943_003393 [Babesia divergens]|uniref:Uncharacterized protein n=1 Tax=Babesia divergens TaxID=32595 RepID=A0AAD9G7T0_BABDI|nr:hypothetical protein X943_003393 [Babesia divergens]